MYVRMFEIFNLIYVGTYSYCYLITGSSWLQCHEPAF